MTGLTRSIALMIGLSVGILALGFAGAARAQENLDAGKTPAQLYASDCAICHKTTRGLSHVGGVFGLEGFLREHYTASRESAAKIAGYLRKVDRGPAPSKHRRASQSSHGKHRKAAGKKPAQKTGATKSAAKKSGGQKPAEKKSAEKKPAAPAEAKAVDTKPSATGPKETKTGEAKPAEAKTEPKSDAKSVSAKPSKSTPSKPKTTDGEASQPKTGAAKHAKSDKPKDAKPVE